MAVLTALVRLLEVKMLQMEEGTGVLEDDVKLLQVGSARLPVLAGAKGIAAVDHTICVPQVPYAGLTSSCAGWAARVSCMK